MEGNFGAHGDGFVLTQQPTELNCNGSGCFDCNICLDTAQDPVVTLCGHLFCWPCIYRWLDMQKKSPSSAVSITPQQSCPVCKSNISIGWLVPLHGRGTSSSSSSSSSETRMIIPQRPASSSSLNNLIPSASSPNPSLQHDRNQAQSPVIGMFW